MLCHCFFLLHLCFCSGTSRHSSAVYLFDLIYLLQNTQLRMPLIPRTNLWKAHLRFHLFCSIKRSVEFHSAFILVSVGIFSGYISRWIDISVIRPALQWLEVVDYVIATVASFAVKIMKEILLYLDSLSVRQFCLPPAVC